MPQLTPTPPGVFPIVGIGASAGGLEAFTQLLQALPADTGMAFVLVQHLDPRHDSRLADLLAKTTRMSVQEAAPRPGHRARPCVRHPPQYRADAVAEGALQVEPRGEGRAARTCRSTISSARSPQQRQAAPSAWSCRARARDGTLGLEEIKAAGGITFAQDEDSAKYHRHAQTAAAYGLRRPGAAARRASRPSWRASARHPYWRPAPARDSGEAPADERRRAFQGVLALLRASTGVDFSAYRDTTIRRRILRRMMLHGGCEPRRLRRATRRATAPSSRRCTRTS